MYRKPTTARALFDLSGELLALVADGENPLAFLDTAEGAQPLDRAGITAALGELDPDALQAVVDAAIAEGQAIAASDDPIDAEVLARINLLADAREVAEGRISELVAADEEAQRQAAEALARLAPPAAAEETPGEEETPAEETPAEQPEAVAASAGSQPARRFSALPRPGSGAAGRASTNPPAAQQEQGAAVPTARASLVASAGLEGAGIQGGTAIQSRETLGDAILSKLRSLRRVSGGDGENVPVATLNLDFPEERTLGRELSVNTRRIREATAPEVLVASAEQARAGGALVAAALCAPINTDYDVPVIGSSARPLRDSLTRFGADKGGLRWREHLSFADFAGATSVWTMANDEAVGTAQQVTKPCLDVECPDDAEAFVEALTFCLTFSNVTARFDPESTAANVEAAQIAHARFAENRLMAQIAALSTTVTSDSVLGSTRDLLVGLDRLQAAYRNFFRLEDSVALRLAAPRWGRDMLRADLTRGMAGELEALAVADATINAWFAARNVNITWHLDGRPATVAGVGEVAMADQFYGALADNAALPDFPAQMESLLWVEGEMLHLDGGTMDLGVVRDSTLNQVNRYKLFSESFEGVAHRGVQAVRWVADTATLGSVSGTTDVAAVLAA